MTSLGYTRGRTIGVCFLPKYRKIFWFRPSRVIHWFQRVLVFLVPSPPIPTPRTPHRRDDEPLIVPDELATDYILLFVYPSSVPCHATVPQWYISLLKLVSRGYLQEPFGSPSTIEAIIRRVYTSATYRSSCWASCCRLACLYSYGIPSSSTRSRTGVDLGCV